MILKLIGSFYAVLPTGQLIESCLFELIPKGKFFVITKSRETFQIYAADANGKRISDTVRDGAMTHFERAIKEILDGN